MQSLLRLLSESAALKTPRRRDPSSALPLHERPLAGLVKVSRDPTTIPVSIELMHVFIFLERFTYPFEMAGVGSTAASLARFSASDRYGTLAGLLTSRGMSYYLDISVESVVVCMSFRKF